MIALPADPVKEGKLMELVRLAKSGQSAAVSRVCLCGRCQLNCRSGLHTRQADSGMSEKETEHENAASEEPIAGNQSGIQEHWDNEELRLMQTVQDELPR